MAKKCLLTISICFQGMLPFVFPYFFASFTLCYLCRNEWFRTEVIMAPLGGDLGEKGVLVRDG